MRKLIFLLLFFFTTVSYGQDNLVNLLVSGVSDAQRFAQLYLNPGGESLIENLSNGWFNSAETKRKLDFEITIIGNVTFIGADNRNFILNTNDFENLRFEDGVTQREVASVFGDAEDGVIIIEGPLPGAADDIRQDLPTGLGSENINFAPSTFVQASVGIFNGGEVKLRFVPRININDAEAGLFGAGFQYEFTSRGIAKRISVLAISGLISYTNLSGSYNLSATNLLDGSNQRIENSTDSWLFQSIFSTRYPVFNIYGGFGYTTGRSETNLLGTYTITSGVNSGTTFTNPLSVVIEDSSIRATLGLKVQLGIVRLHTDYTISNYNNFSFGINFGSK